jgi:hypothetical protein
MASDEDKREYLRKLFESGKAHIVRAAYDNASMTCPLEEVFYVRADGLQTKARVDRRIYTFSFKVD